MIKFSNMIRHANRVGRPPRNLSTDLRTPVGEPEIKVLWSVRQPGFDANPFITSLAGSITRDIEVVFFTWKRALMGKYDLVHIHWPEDLFRARKSSTRFIKYVLFLALVIRLRVSDIPVIWTVHNNAPHEGVSRLERKLLEVCLGLVKQRVFMTAAQQKMLNDDVPGVVIRHGHYKDSYPMVDCAGEPTPESNLLYFGFVRRYKGLEKLLESFSALESQQGQRLTIAGRPNPAGYGDELLTMYGEIPGVEWRLDFQTNESTSHLFAEADLVVLPYKNMVNSGTLLLGLSLGKPVLAPSNAVTREIQDEVGDTWLHLYDGELSAKDLHDAVTQSCDALREGIPDLSLREWKLIGQNYSEVYRGLVT